MRRKLTVSCHKTEAMKFKIPSIKKIFKSKLSLGLFALSAAYLMIVNNLRKSRGGDDGSSSSKTLKVIPNQCDSPSRGHFDAIYETGMWGKKTRQASDFYGDAAWPPKAARQKSASGGGSDLGYSTETSLKMIKDTIYKRGGFFGAKTLANLYRLVNNNVTRGLRAIQQLKGGQTQDRKIYPGHAIKRPVG